MRTQGLERVQGVTLLFTLAVFTATLFDGTQAMYCGDRNCYDVLKCAPQVPGFYYMASGVSSVPDSEQIVDCPACASDR